MSSKKNQTKKFDIETFEKVIQTALKDVRKNFSLLIHAYRWAQVHEKEINRRWKGFSRGWFQDQIKRDFMTDPAHYSKIVCRLAKNSQAIAKTRRAFEFAKRVGAWELYRADRLLTVPQMGRLQDKFSGGKEQIPTVEFQIVVDEMARILREAKPGVTTTNGKKTRGQLEKEIAALKTELRLLREQLSDYKKLIDRSRLVVKK